MILIHVHGVLHLRRRKKQSKRSTKRTTPATPSSSKIADAADTADKATPTSDPTDDESMDTSPDSLSFPFELTDAQVQSLNKLTAEEWLQHCQKVRANAPRTEPEVDRFLSLPIEEIV